MLQEVVGVSLGCALALAACNTRRDTTRTTADSSTTDSVGGPQWEPPLRETRLAPNRGIRAASLVDSTTYAFEIGDLYVYRVAVHHDSSIDTLPDLRALYPPVLVGDSVLLGVAYDSASDAYSLFSYSAPNGQIVFYSPPQDLRLRVSVPAFAPDGKELAYVAFAGDETGNGVVRRWPAGEIVAQTPRVTVPATDMISGRAIWQDITHFELDISVSNAAYVRFRGVRGRTGFDADTVLFSEHPH